MRRFLVEVYVPARACVAPVELARSALAATRAVEDVRLIGSLLLADDEVCLHVFEAPSRRALVRALDATRVPRERVAATVWLEPVDL